MATITQGPLGTATPDAEKPKTDATTEKKETKKAEPRPYQIGVPVSGTADKLKSEIDRLVGSGRGEIIVVVGEAEGIQPKIAMKKFSQKNEVEGHYQAVAHRSISKFGPLKSTTVTKNTVEGL